MNLRTSAEIKAMVAEAVARDKSVAADGMIEVLIRTEHAELVLIHEPATRRRKEKS